MERTTARSRKRGSGTCRQLHFLDKLVLCYTTTLRFDSHILFDTLLYSLTLRHILHSRFNSTLNSTLRLSSTMAPTVEVLPKSATSSGANWTYTTLPPAYAVSGGLTATGGRGTRNRQTNYENTAARQRQINSRISDLEKDNYREVHIPIPKSTTNRGEFSWNWLSRVGR